MGNEITQGQIDGWIAELEDWLPRKINGITGEGAEVLLKHTFIPHSVRIDEILQPENCQLTACYLVVTYRVKQVTEGEEFGTFETIDLRGAVEIPVGLNGVLILAGVDPLDGVLAVGEGLAVHP